MKRPIPPLSIVRLVHADSHTPAWKRQIGRTFRIGYYCRKCGTDCVWLVNDAGVYEQTVDQRRLLAYFEIIQRSGERALFGRNRPPIPTLSTNGNSRLGARRRFPITRQIARQTYNRPLDT